jgi:hypothetical protein
MISGRADGKLSEMGSGKSTEMGSGNGIKVFGKEISGSSYRVFGVI